MVLVFRLKISFGRTLTQTAQAAVAGRGRVSREQIIHVYRQSFLRLHSLDRQWISRTLLHKLIFRMAERWSSVTFLKGHILAFATCDWSIDGARQRHGHHPQKYYILLRLLRDDGVILPAAIRPSLIAWSAAYLSSLCVLTHGKLLPDVLSSFRGTKNRGVEDAKRERGHIFKKKSEEQRQLWSLSQNLPVSYPPNPVTSFIA